MTTTISSTVSSTVPTTSGRTAARRRIPLRRLVAVELRKSFDTRSGFWLLVGLGIASVSTTCAVIAWAPRDHLVQSQFTLAVGVPLSILLPIIATLSVTAEWTQRSGLATFTLVPHRGRVLLAKALAVLLVAAVSTVVAFAVGAGGNLAGSTLRGAPVVWDQGRADAACFTLANILMVLVGFTLGALIRNSPGAVVGYMVYAFVAPGLLAFLALNQRWFDEIRPWVDAKYNQDVLLRGDGLSGSTWAHLAVTSAAWVVLPMIIAVARLLRAEVK